MIVRPQYRMFFYWNMENFASYKFTMLAVVSTVASMAYTVVSGFGLLPTCASILTGIGEAGCKKVNNIKWIHPHSNSDITTIAHGLSENSELTCYAFIRSIDKITCLSACTVMAIGSHHSHRGAEGTYTPFTFVFFSTLMTNPIISKL